MSKRGADDEHSLDVSDADMEALNGILKEQDRVEIIVDREAERRYAPIFEKRRAIVAKIPKFWPMALGQHAELYAFLQNKEDQDAISYLREINVIRDTKESRAFTLEFYFNENPYFSDTVLRKEYQYSGDAGNESPDADGLTPSALAFSWETDISPQAITINWKSDAKNLVAKYPARDDEDEDEDAMDVEEKAGSFFNLFESEEDTHELGVIIADDVFPNAIDYFLGRGPNGLDAWEDDEDDEDEEDDDDDADEIDLEKPRKSRK